MKPSVRPSSAELDAATTRPNRANASILIVVLAILAAHAAVFSRWQVDDAGISYAYARNLAALQGLVSQPGSQPVEGYSNPLWTLTIAVFWATGLFSLHWTPKILAFLLNATVFYKVARDLAPRTNSRWAVAIPLGILAACTPFVIWTFSGLENALFACLVVWLVSLSLASARSLVPSAGLDRRAGVVAGLIALTRPDGLVYVLAYLLLMAVEESQRGPGFFRRAVVTGPSAVYGVRACLRSLRGVSLLVLRRLGAQHGESQGGAITLVARCAGQTRRAARGRGR